MYLGFNYDLARGKQDERLRWAEEQRRWKRVRRSRSADVNDKLPGLKPEGRPDEAPYPLAGHPLAESAAFEDLRAS